MSRHRSIPTKGKGNLYDSDEDEIISSSYEDSYSISPDTSERYMYDSSRHHDRTDPCSFIQINTTSKTSAGSNFIDPEEFTDVTHENDFGGVQFTFVKAKAPQTKPFQSPSSTLNASSKKPLPKFDQFASDSVPIPLTSKHNGSNTNSTAKGFGPVLHESATLTDLVSLERQQSANATKTPHFERSLSSSRLLPAAHGPPSGASTPLQQQQSVESSAAAEQRMALIRQAFTEHRSRYDDNKPSLALVIIGHVDAGKSTLMGHLLYRLGQVDDRQMSRFQRDAQKQGKSSFAYAWVLDQTEEERSRGVTMDIAQTAFSTAHKRVIVLDAPGHRDFIPRMISGTAQADAALLVINATNGEFETGFSSASQASGGGGGGGADALTSDGSSGTSNLSDGQTREHVILARALGISQFLVGINKMDTVAWSQERYAAIQAQLETFFRRLGAQLIVRFCPVSGLEGCNVFQRLELAEKRPEGSQWYEGPCLVELIDEMASPERQIERALRFTVSDSFKPGAGGGVCVSGRVETGALCCSSAPGCGDLCQVSCRPYPQTTFQIKSIQRTAISGSNSASANSLGGEQGVFWAFAGDCVSLTLGGGGTDTQQASQIEPGCVLFDMVHPPPAMVVRFRAQLLLVNVPRALCRGFTAVLHWQSVTVPATLQKLVRFQGRDGGKKVSLDRPRFVTGLGQLDAIVKLDRPLCLETIDNCRALSRFTLRNNSITIAGGHVVEILPKS